METLSAERHHLQSLPARREPYRRAHSQLPNGYQATQAHLMHTFTTPDPLSHTTADTSPSSPILYTAKQVLRVNCSLLWTGQHLMRTNAGCCSGRFKSGFDAFQPCLHEEQVTPFQRSKGICLVILCVNPAELMRGVPQRKVGTSVDELEMILL
jgi:hypothetical protein